MDPALDVILNRASGAEDEKPHQGLVRLIRSSFREAVVSAADGGSDITGLARRAVDRGGRIVVAGGGDGTVSAVVSVLAGTQAAHERCARSFNLSDLRFGRIHRELLCPLVMAAWETRPRLVAVSGDLTRRALASQLKEARAFLDSLPKPRIVVPGNHDIPFYSPVLRLLSQLSRFRRSITTDTFLLYVDDENAVLGLRSGIEGASQIMST